MKITSSATTPDEFRKDILTLIQHQIKHHEGIARNISGKYAKQQEIEIAHELEQLSYRIQSIEFV